jgi:hypothetical protein
MKKIILISAIVMSGIYYNTANAQIRVHFGFHFGAHPVYVQQQAPIEYVEPVNYDGDEDYYYLPEVDAYYSVPEECYYYNDGGQWITAAYLPGAYRDYDWRSARRFEVRAPRPFIHDDYYRERYNGVAFNGRWDHDYNRGYANENRFNHGQYRRDNQRFDNNRGWGGYNHNYEQNRGQQNFDHNRWQNDQRFEQNRNRDMGSAQQHFAQNNFQRNDRGESDNHRPAR